MVDQPSEQEAAERRRHERVDIELPVTIRYKGRLIPATALNLSCGGMMLDADSPAVQEGGRVEVVVDLSALERDVSLRGEIVRREFSGSKTRIGIRFTNLFTMGHDAVVRYLRRHGLGH
ncbi:MAG: PilZ domain-containing protein [Deltaproteobacteria bacterium]|nr:PilZ domain-containing protein [Deltaproteobacteria bacterium]